MTVSAGSDSVEAKAEGDGVFTLAAPWLARTNGVDLVFALTISDGTQDLLTGRLQSVAALSVPAASQTPGWQLSLWRRSEVWMFATGGVMLGVLATLF